MRTRNFRQAVKFVSPAAIVICITLTCIAQQSAVVPHLVTFSGKATDATGRAIAGIAGATFAIYKDQSGGAPLWLETQNIQADAKGNYTVQLGTTEPNGLPLDVFTSGEARWLGVTINGGQEQPRVLLLSVPYALKAADAETIGGLPPSAFVLAAPASGAGAPAAAVSSDSSANGVLPALAGGGTLDFVPLWTPDGSTLGNSVLFQSGTGSTAKIGINTTTPATTLDVNGAAAVRGNLNSPPTGTATAASGKNSQPTTLTASAFNSSTGKAVGQSFRWQAEPARNNTSSPSGKLSLLFGSGSGTPAETGFNIASNGQVTFAPGQTFPGTGGVSSVGLTAPATDFTVTGSPVTGNGTLTLDWTVPPTSADTGNAIVKRDFSGSFNAGTINSGNIVAAGAITATFGITAPQLTVSNPAGVAVVASTSSANAAITGTSTGTNAVSDGVDGITTSGTASGVAGINSGGGVGVYGTGQWGVYGQLQSPSPFSGAYAAGVFGESGVFNGIGVFGGADNGFAGIFMNHASNGLPALVGWAYGTGTLPFEAYNFGSDPLGEGCNIDSSGNLNCTGTKNAVVPIDGGKRKVAMSAIESPENWFEDFGSAQLVNGVAVITLDPDFIQTVNTEKNYRVFPVPNGDCKGLYVTNKTANSFEVHELGGGMSSVSFDYRITAIRRKYETVRFADHTNDPDPRKMLEQTRKPTPVQPASVQLTRK